ncbi:glycerophosphodiester phosphodiesterase 1 isoform X2 [Leptinotarsa decemlineata]|uniref:glycerophosphodiester phosphodiesterase 1 isoform X2 n=1 Tax=Leptinotarsa decemlineata TaxID=7539 RepID=UPI003D3046A0
MNKSFMIFKSLSQSTMNYMLVKFIDSVSSVVHRNIPVVLRVPPPEPSAVEAVLGKDPHLETTSNDYVMKTVAHRGAGLDAPENSLAAFKLCNQKGCDAIEFDVCLTKDGVPIVFHDNTLERMANSNLIVGDTTWEDLANIDISVNHSQKERFVNTKIPTLEQTVQQLLTDGQRMFIDIKDNNYKMVGVIQELFKKYPELVSRAVVTSFFPNIIYWIRRGNPEIVGSLSYRPYAFSRDSFKYPEGKGNKRTEAVFKYYLLCSLDALLAWAVPRIIYYILGLSTILLHKDAISGEVILDWRDKGVRVIAWSVNSPIEKQHLARNLKISYLTDTLTGETTVHNAPS